MAFTLQNIWNEVGDRLNLDPTITANQTRLTRWANIIIQDIASRNDGQWEWLYTNGFIQTVTDQTTGTITTVKGSANFTGLGTAFTTANAAGCYLQVANDTNWYEVSSVSGQVLTCTEPAITSASGLTYTLRTTYYDLPSNCWKVLDVRQTNTPAKLTCLGIYSLDLFQPDINTTSNPTGYFLFGLDPKVSVSVAKQEQIAFFPCPDSLYNIQFRYQLIQSDLSTNTDIPLIPVVYQNVLYDGVEWLGNKFINDPGEEKCKAMYENGIENMILSESANGDYFPIVQSSDNMINQNPYLQMPGNYPSPNSGDY